MRRVTDAWQIRMHQTTPCLVGDDAGNAGVLGAHAGASIILLPVDTSLLRPAGCRWWAGLAVGVAAEGSEGQGVSCQEPWLTTTTATGSARPRGCQSCLPTRRIAG